VQDLSLRYEEGTALKEVEGEQRGSQELWGGRPLRNEKVTA